MADVEGGEQVDSSVKTGQGNVINTKKLDEDKGSSSNGSFCFLLVGVLFCVTLVGLVAVIIVYLSIPGNYDTDTAVSLIRKQITPKLLRNVEGGMFVETWRTNYTSFSRIHNDTRDAGTAIYYMLMREETSYFHVLTSDEIWFWHRGASMKIHMITPEGEYSIKVLGDMLVDSAATFQVLVTRGIWFAAEVTDKSSYSLVSTVVAPGFEYADFRMDDKEKLKKMFPDHKAIIDRLGKPADIKSS